MAKLNKNTWLLIFLASSMLLCEMLVFLLLDMAVLPKYVWFDIAVIIIAVGVTIALPNFISKSVFVWFVVFIQFILNLANIVIDSATNEIFSFDMLVLAGEGLQAFDPSFINVPKILCLFLMLFLQIGVFIIICKQKNSKFLYKKFNLPLILCLVFSFQAGGYGIYALQKITLSEGNKNSEFYMFESDKYLYENLSSKWDCLERFGTFGFYVKDFSRFVLGRSSTEDMINKTVEYFSNANLVKSEVFGVSEGNNLITVLLESVEMFGIDPYFTPTLYKIFYEDGVLLNNFYANNRTNISEGLVLAGNYPRENPLNLASDDVLSVLGNKENRFTLAGKLLEEDYSTTYVHNNVSWFYNRDKTHGESGMGFQNTLFLENMNLIDAWVDFEEDPDNEYYDWYNWTLDSEVMKKYVNYMCPTDKKFYTHFSTISSHGAFVERESMKPNYDKLVKDKNVQNGNYDKMWEYLYSLGYVKPESEHYLEMFHWYKSAVMDVDKAIETLFKYLTENNMLQNTTVLLFADHNAYYNGLSFEMKGLEYGISEYDTELYHIPVAIYDEKLINKISSTDNVNFLSDNNITVSDSNHIVVDKFTSTYNLLPTLLDLMGIEYNPNFYLNTSIFNTENYLNIFQPNVGGTPFFNDKIYFSFDKIKWKSEDVTEDEILQYKKDAQKLYYKYVYIESLYNNPEIINRIK